MWELIGLGVTAFLSATLLPGSSEAALAASLTLGQASAASAIAVATLGNVAGSCLNWALGRFASHWRDHPRFPVSPEQIARAELFYRRWGVWSLLLSWVPVIGDPLTVVAGFLRTPMLLFLPLVTIGKLARYLALVGILHAAA